jgi:hypothetical protein
MERFHGQHYWTINGPPDTSVDEIMCFCLYSKSGDNLGVCIVQTWDVGGWEIYVPPGLNDGTLDATESAIHRNRASKQLMSCLLDCLEECRSELEQRIISGNDEETEDLAKMIVAGDEAITLARGILVPEEVG